MKVRNTVTGAVGVLRGAWRNIAGQVVLNVRLDGQRSGFEMWDAAKTVKVETKNAA